MDGLAGVLLEVRAGDADDPLAAVRHGHGQLAGLITRLKDDTLSSKTAKTLFEGLWAGEGGVDEIIDARGLKQVSDTGELKAIVDRVVADNPDQVEQFRAGKDKVLGFLVGQVMKATQGKANPKQVNELLREALKG